MSQHRECCCGPEQNFALECLASDKIFPHGVAENTFGDRRGSNQSQVTAPKGRSAGMFIDEQQFYKSRGGAGAAGPRYLTANHVNSFEVSGRDVVGNKLKTRNPDNTTGMGCMLCHGTLIMSTKLPFHSARGMGATSTSCSTADGCSRTKFVSYDFSGWATPPEETMYVMYNAYKDYWYLELGPMGLPHTFYSQRLRYQETFSGNGQNFTKEGLGIRTFGGDDPRFQLCFRLVQHPPTPTDADLMGFPELTACTNPANVMFDDLNISEASNSIRNSFNAWQTGVDNNEPEYANHKTVVNDDGTLAGVGGNWLCTYNVSNRNPWVGIYGSNNPSFFGGNPPCGGDFMPGISSWQAYQLRSQPELRSLGDVMSYGNGAPLFASPSSIIEQNLAPYSSDIGYAPLANAMIGTLHRVRLWMRADQVTIDGAFPCTDEAGQHHAYYPPETNTKMFARDSRPTFGEVGAGFGYSAKQKLCSSGPASLMYACSGVPIFTSDIETLTENGQYPGNGILENLQTLYYGDWSYIEELIGDITSAKCKFGIGQIEEALGETGLFVAKDWRQDQIDKYVSLGSSFKTIAAQNVDNPDLSESDLAALTLFASNDFEGVPASISERISPSSNIELLPSQKIGEQMLTCFITQAGPKQLADAELNADESQEQVLLSEMAYFQGSEFLGQGQGFAIDAIDPWHPKNSGEDWPQLGRERKDPATGQPMTVTLTNPSGNGDEFQFYYPIRSIWNAWRAFNNPNAGNFSDAEWDQVSPAWEQDLFKAWWKNNPIYFHATPGGFGWGGDGAGQDLAHPPGTLSQSSECRWSNDLRKLKNLESINQLGMYGTKRAAVACGNKDTWPVEVQSGALPGAANGPNKIILHGRQLRNRPYRRECDSVSAICFATPAGDGAYTINCAGEDQDPICCQGSNRCSIWNIGGSGTCTGFGGGPDGDGPIDNGGGDPGEPDNGNGCHGVAANFGLVVRNCCRNYNPYGGSNSAGTFATATSSIFQENPTNINSTDSSPTVSLWNKNNPTVSFRDGSLYGSRCTERGECPPGFKCCSVAGCGADSFCIPQAAECTSPPCTSSENFDSPCCQTFGSCCYEDDDGLIRCEDDITQEKCVARKENGGLNGTFTKDVTCRSYPCKTQGVITGACFYTDPLLNHQICRQTTSETCAGFSGEFFADQKCDDITDKIITGYETKVDTLGAKPSLAGDRTCGEFGFSVNCCTQNPDGTQTCEVKCLADCDYGLNGTARIVQSCDSCGEFGHCCTRNGICEPSVTESDCSGTWFPGEECDGRSCEIPLSENQLTKNFGGAPGYRSDPGDDDGFPDDVIIDIDDPNCVPGPCEGNQLPPSSTLDVCLPNNRFGNVASISSPTPPSGNPAEGPLACLVSQDPQASRTCIIKQIQVTRSGMRYAVFTSSQRADGFSGICPTPDNVTVSCCTYNCNPRGHHGMGDSCQSFTDDGEVPFLHQELPTLVANVYPFRIRCAQTRDESGLYKCAVKPEATSVSEQELAQGIIGCGDLYTCHKVYLEPTTPQDEVDSGTCDTENASCDTSSGSGDGCDNTTTVGEPYAEYSNEVRRELKFQPDGAITNINRGSACFDLRRSLHHAQSIAFPSPSGGVDSGAVGQHLYAPAEGMYGVFTPHELSTPIRRPLNQSIDQLPMGTLGQCAEFYNDKLLSDFEDGGFPKPPEPTTLLTFHDYGGLLNTYEDNRTDPPTDTPLGIVDGAPIKAELVDANWNAGQNEETFWMKQEFPSLKYIRFFSAGCFRLPGSHQGGQGITLDEGTDLEQRVGGDFAGTLVPVFGSEEDRDRYDGYYGSENLKLSFVTTPPGYPTGPGDEINPAITDGEVYFVARPSNNPRKAAGYNTDPDDPGGDANAGLYSRVGYLDGLGLTYANVSNDQVGEYDGKVYEFCVPVGKDTGNVNQLKPIFTTGEEIPPFSGLRGPIGLFSDGSGDDGGRFIVDLKRFSETVVTEETLGECSRSWSYVIDLPENQSETEILGSDFYQGSETDIDDGERCFYEGYLNEDSQGDERIWNRSWFANLSGITDGGSIGCCHHNNENLECTGWELGGAGQNAGNNVFRRANTSDDCRADL